MALIVLLALVVPNPVKAGVESDRIQSLITEGKLRRALTLTEKQLMQDESSVTFRFLKGLILTRLDKLDDARDLFQELTREHPDLPEPYNNLAVIYASQGDLEKARDALQKAISTHPSYATAHENIGDIYAKMASRAYNQALQLDADNTSAKAKLSLVNDLFFVPSSEAPVMEAVAQMESRPAAPAVSGPAAAPGSPAAAAPPEIGKDKPAGKVAMTAPADTRVVKNGAESGQEPLKTAIVSTINDWAAAWSAQDVKRYIEFYAGDFSPPDNMTRKSWEAERKARLERPGYIRLEITDVDVSILGSNHAKAVFRQAYESNTYRDEVTKTLILKKSADGWRIIQEDSK